MVSLVVWKQMLTNVSYYTLSTQILSPLVSQSGDYFKNLKDYLHKTRITRMRYTLIIITTIWILMSTILSKSFSNSLLSTYFGRQTKPMVHSMDQLIDTNVDFKVALQDRDRQKYRQLMPTIFDKLYEMPARLQWIKSVGYDYHHTIRCCENIANGNKVLLISSFSTDKLLGLCPHLPLTVGNRYAMNFLVTAMSKRHAFGKQITDL